MEAEIIEESEWKLAKVNTSTGELIRFNSDFKTPQEKYADKIEKEYTRLIKLNEEKGLVLFSNTYDPKYVVTYVDVSRRNPFKKNAKYRGYLDILRDNLCRYTNAIVYDREKPNQIPKPMNTVDMIAYLEIGKSAFYEFMAEAKKLGVICHATYDVGGVKKEAYLLNPAYAHQSVELSWEVMNAFANDKAFQSILTPQIKEQILRLNNKINYLK